MVSLIYPNPFLSKLINATHNINCFIFCNILKYVNVDISLKVCLKLGG